MISQAARANLARSVGRLLQLSAELVRVCAEIEIAGWLGEIARTAWQVPDEPWVSIVPERPEGQ